MDVSPAPLFPYFDLDTQILLLYSRGDRTCLAFEVHPEAAPGKQLVKLPSFEHGTLQLGWAFLPKKENNIKGVEILSSLRLTSGEVQKVSWSVPRARVSHLSRCILRFAMLSFPPFTVHSPSSSKMTSLSLRGT